MLYYKMTEYTSTLFDLLKGVCEKDYLCDGNIKTSESLLLENDSLRNNSDITLNAAHVDKLSPQQKEILVKYAGWAYLMMNKVGDKSDEELVDEFGEAWREVIRKARRDAVELDAIMAGAPRNKKDSLCFVV